LKRLHAPIVCESFNRCFKHKRELHVDTTERAVNDEKAHRSAVFVTWLGLGKNITLCAGKAIIGVQSNSAALVADAFHSLSDMVSDAVAMVALKVARRPPNPLHPYGHGKFEAIGALGVSTMLMVAGGGLIVHAAELCWAAQAVVAPSSPALWASLACAGINEVRICTRAAPPLPPCTLWVRARPSVRFPNMRARPARTRDGHGVLVGRRHDSMESPCGGGAGRAVGRRLPVAPGGERRPYPARIRLRPYNVDDMHTLYRSERPRCAAAPSVAPPPAREHAGSALRGGGRGADPPAQPLSVLHNIPVCLSVCLSLCLPTYLPTYLPIYLID
jgi:hypothetical protein